jgi:aspartate 1-decarboxylase
MLKSKIHRARVTGADIHYEGSISIDPELMELADFVEYEQVHVFNVDNGERLVTYVIQGERGSGDIVLNGAAARKVCVGDKVIIASFDMIAESEVENHRPTIVLVDENNQPRE